MSGYELVFSRGARKEYEALDGSVRSMLNKGLARLYRIRDGQVQIVDILAIGARDHDRAFRDAERRLGDEG